MSTCPVGSLEQLNPNLALGRHSTLTLDQQCHKCAIRRACTADLVSGPVQAVVPAHRGHHTHQLRRLSAAIALPAQGHAESVPEAGGRCTRAAPWAEVEVETRHSH